MTKTKRSIVATPSRTHLQRRYLIGLGMILAALLVVGIIAASVQRQGTAGPAPTPTIDPRLVLHPQKVPIAAVLPGNVRLSGTLYPGIPGANTLQLHVQHGGAEPQPLGRIDLAATMPGMQMVPVKASLTPHERTYSGTIILPMFGRYLAKITVVTPTGPAIEGTFMLPLSLPNL